MSPGTGQGVVAGEDQDGMDAVPHEATPIVNSSALTPAEIRHKKLLRSGAPMTFAGVSTNSTRELRRAMARIEKRLATRGKQSDRTITNPAGRHTLRPRCR